MKWLKWSELKGKIEVGDVLVCSFCDCDSINRAVCFCVVGTEGELMNAHDGHVVKGLEPDYAFFLTKPDQRVVKYFV